MRTEPLLLVLDLNGSLLHRIKKSKDKQLVRANPFAPALSFRQSGSQVFLRANLQTFIDGIFSIPYLRVAVWTSAQKANAEELTRMTFGPYYDSLVVIHNLGVCL
jgi:NLI interacting factor-like phosphatase